MGVVDLCVCAVGVAECGLHIPTCPKTPTIKYAAYHYNSNLWHHRCSQQVLSATSTLSLCVLDAKRVGSTRRYRRARNTRGITCARRTNSFLVRRRFWCICSSVCVLGVDPYVCMCMCKRVCICIRVCIYIKSIQVTWLG